MADPIVDDALAAQQCTADDGLLVTFDMASSPDFEERCQTCVRFAYT